MRKVDLKQYWNTSLNEIKTATPYYVNQLVELEKILGTKISSVVYTPKSDRVQNFGRIVR